MIVFKMGLYMFMNDKKKDYFYDDFKFYLVVYERLVNWEKKIWKCMLF